MPTIQIILLIALGLGAGVLGFFVIKSFISPQRIGTIQKLLKQGKTTGAIKLAKTIVTKDNRDFQAHYYLGKAYYMDNKFELALMEFKIVNENAIFDEMDIPEAEFRKLSAILYKKFKQIDEALKEYLLLTKIAPGDADTFFQIGSLFEEKNKTEQALNYYQKAITLNPRHVQAHSARAMILYRNKQFADARKAIEKAISLSPETFSSYYYLGKILKENKEYANAVNSFEKALRDAEFRQRALIERGSCYIAVNNIEKAIDEFDRAIRSAKRDDDNETLYARYFLATCYEKQRKVDSAIKQWEKIYQHNKAFRDVASKLMEYKDLTVNDNMKEYLTSFSENFVELCKHITSTSLNLSVKEAGMTKSAVKIIAKEGKSENWMNVRVQLYLLLFFRETEQIGENIVRTVAEQVKKQNYIKALIFTSSGFTRSASQFAESRPIELINKDKLQQLLDKITL